MSLEDVYKTDFSFEVSPTGDIDRISGIPNIKKALFRMLTTNKGTLIHRPNYGVGIKDFQNSLSTLGAKKELAGIIKEQFERDPRIVKVEGVSINQDKFNPNLFNIGVRVQIQGLGEQSFSYQVGDLP